MAPLGQPRAGAGHRRRHDGAGAVRNGRQSLVFAAPRSCHGGADRRFRRGTADLPARRGVARLYLWLAHGDLPRDYRVCRRRHPVCSARARLAGRYRHGTVRGHQSPTPPSRGRRQRGQHQPEGPAGGHPHPRLLGTGGNVPDLRPVHLRHRAAALHPILRRQWHYARACR